MRPILTKILVLAALVLLSLPTANANDGALVRCALDLPNCLH